MNTLFICALVACLALLANGDHPLITIESGTLKGSAQTSFGNRTFYSFTGVPYAKPPIESYRFEPPQAFGRWEGIYDATRSHAKCLQFIRLARTQQNGEHEDCLYLNVYTAQLPLSTDVGLLPVMFFVHGGAFFEGTAQREEVGPELLMDQDIVLVTANYRLGVLGFFSTGDEVVPGNMGLKDQALALKWVANNIQSFGGNPKKVTIFGHSAGAASAHFHMFSDLSKDLLHGVIAQSGTAFSRWALFPPEELRNNSLTFAEIAGCKTGASKDLINCLKHLKGMDMIKAEISLHENRGTRFFYFGPTIEVKATGAFLSDAPVDIARSGRVAKVPFVTGIAAQDGAMFVPSILADMPATNRHEYLEQIFPLFLWYSKDANVTKAIRDHHFGNNPANFSSLNALTKMCTDGLFVEAAYESIQIHSTRSSPVYYYLFEYQGSETYASGYNMDLQFGVTHGDELLYLFNNTVKFPGYFPTKSDKKMIELLTTLWADFAKYGVPTPNGNKFLAAHWKKFNRNKQHFYHFKNDATTVCERNLFADAPRIWDNLKQKFPGIY